jgi:hypothetical protein
MIIHLWSFLSAWEVNFTVNRSVIYPKYTVHTSTHLHLHRIRSEFRHSQFRHCLPFQIFIQIKIKNKNKEFHDIISLARGSGSMKKLKSQNYNFCKVWNSNFHVTLKKCNFFLAPQCLSSEMMSWNTTFSRRIVRKLDEVWSVWRKLHHCKNIAQLH